MPSRASSPRSWLSLSADQSRRASPGGAMTTSPSPAVGIRAQERSGAGCHLAGSAGRMVPFNHGRWLAANIPARKRGSSTTKVTCHSSPHRSDPRGPRRAGYRTELAAVSGQPRRVPAAVSCVAGCDAHVREDRSSGLMIKAASTSRMPPQSPSPGRRQELHPRDVIGWCRRGACTGGFELRERWFRGRGRQVGLDCGLPPAAPSFRRRHRLAAWNAGRRRHDGRDGALAACRERWRLGRHPAGAGGLQGRTSGFYVRIAIRRRRKRRLVLVGLTAYRG